MICHKGYKSERFINNKTSGLVFFMLANSSNMEFQHNINSLFYLENISVDYGNIRALQSLNLTIEKGEIIFITGASGAGKTT
ncbi:MAG: hypothetical protein HOJ35_08505, partial [Bdellovibrionales bacterium]|nr:hypothetical protein [Bdellovibrionales bacterium]